MQELTTVLIRKHVCDTVRGATLYRYDRLCLIVTLKGSIMPKSRACMHHKVVGNFGSEADVRSLYYRRFGSNETSHVGACAHGRPAK